MDGLISSEFFHAAYEEEFGRVKGPINCVAFQPDGKRYPRIEFFQPVLL
uniref:Uncharacterized protein n=1 Tax=Cynoglossus semilaevis TaxID=244447 RepID=A0A3P8VDE6_CYNSE